MPTECAPTRTVYILIGKPATGKSRWAEANNLVEIFGDDCDRLRMVDKKEFAFSGACRCNNAADAILATVATLPYFLPFKATVISFGEAQETLVSDEPVMVLEDQSSVAQFRARMESLRET